MLWGVLLLTEPYVDFLCLISAGVGRPVNRAMPVVTSNEPDDKHSCESIKKNPFNKCLFCVLYNTGSSRDFRIGGSGRKWHLWTSVQGWCEPPSVCVSQLKMRARLDGNWKRKRHYLCFYTSFFQTYIRARPSRLFVLLSGLDYHWFSPCFTSTHFSDAHIIPVHLF